MNSAVKDRKSFADQIADEIEALRSITDFGGLRAKKAIAYAREHAEEWEQSAMSVTDAADLAISCV